MHGPLRTTKHTQHSQFILSMKGHPYQCCSISLKLPSHTRGRISQSHLQKSLKSLVLVIRYAQSCNDRYNTYLQCFTQILGVTADNASNNDKMIEHLTTLIEDFPRAANQTWCFMLLTWKVMWLVKTQPNGLCAVDRYISRVVDTQIPKFLQLNPSYLLLSYSLNTPKVRE